MPKVFTSKPGYVGIMIIDGAVPGSIQLRGTQIQGVPTLATGEENFRGLAPLATTTGRRLIQWDSRETFDKYKQVNARVVPARRVIFTGIEYEQASHVQFQQTLLRSIYMYSFGERMGSMTISGLGLSSSCYYSFARSNGLVGYRTIQDNRSGVEDVLKAYNTHRVSFDHEMLKITIGGETIRGFMVGCQIRSTTPENMTYSWSFNLATLPRDLY